MIRRALDLSDGTARLAETDPELRTIELQHAAPAEIAPLINDKLSSLVVPDSLCTIKPVVLPAERCRDFRGHTVFELQQGLIDPPAEFLFSVCPTGEQTSFIGVTSRVTQIREILGLDSDRDLHSVQILPRSLASGIGLAKLGLIPSQVGTLLIVGSDSECGFSIVRDNQVISAGHCRTEPNHDIPRLVDDIKTAVTTSLLRSGNTGVVLKVDRVLVSTALEDRRLFELLSAAFNVSAEPVVLGTSDWTVSTNGASDSPEQFLAAIGAALS